MTVVEINSTNFGSTGNIMLQIAEKARANGMTCYTCCPKSRSNMKKTLSGQLFIGSRMSRNLHILLGSLSGFQGCFSVLSTIVFLRKLSALRPSVIHLHNLHGNYINLPLLFSYIKRHRIPVVWTLHDCWAMTGQCPHFTMTHCDKWKSGCHDCEQIHVYPAARTDMTRMMWRLKKRWFTGVEHMTLATPSLWLAELTRDSFLNEYPVLVVNNGIDLAIYKPTQSDFRDRYGIAANMYIVLGVASGWGKRKGIDVFVELSKRLDDRFTIVLVGTDAEVDAMLPANVVSIHHTESQKQLAEIYTAADVFANPTREENYPTVNMEAIACGTPVITFRTGGSPEIPDDKSGLVVNNIDDMEREIIRVCTTRPFTEEGCLARAKSFDKEMLFAAYINLFKKTVDVRSCKENT